MHARLRLSSRSDRPREVLNCLYGDGDGRAGGVGVADKEQQLIAHPAAPALPCPALLMITRLGRLDRVQCAMPQTPRIISAIERQTRQLGIHQVRPAPSPPCACAYGGRRSCCAHVPSMGRLYILFLGGAWHTSEKFGSGA